jgi:hypothetical protein
LLLREGRLKKSKFYLPKHLVKGYDGHTLWFNITEDEAEDTFKKDRPSKEREYSRYKSASVTEQYDNVSLSNTTITEVSQTNGYNIEERLPLLEKKDTIKNTTTGTGDSSAKSGIEDWDYYTQRCKYQRYATCRQCYGSNRYFYSYYFRRS